MALLPSPVTVGGALLLLGACASTTLQCIQGEGAVVSSSLPQQALTPPGCRVRGTGIDGVADLVCEGGRQGFLLDGAALSGGAATP